MKRKNRIYAEVYNLARKQGFSKKNAGKVAEAAAEKARALRKPKKKDLIVDLTAGRGKIKVHVLRDGSKDFTWHHRKAARRVARWNEERGHQSEWEVNHQRATERPGYVTFVGRQPSVSAHTDVGITEARARKDNKKKSTRSRSKSSEEVVQAAAEDRSVQERILAKLGIDISILDEGEDDA